jgi:hypothetical protein
MKCGKARLNVPLTDIDNKTIPPMKKEGIAGGEKYKVNGIYFKVNCSQA